MRNPEAGPLPSFDVFESLLGDTSTTAFHEEVIARATNIAKQLDDVEGVLLTGSLGKGEGDVFSDIDFQILHEGAPEQSVAILDLFMSRLDEVGNMIHFFPSTASSADCIIYLEPFVKFELSVRTLENASRSWKTPMAKILFDKRGLVRKAIKSADSVTFSLEKHMPTIRGRAVAIPAFCYITGGHIVRGEHITALDGVNWMRNDMLVLSGWLLGKWDEGPRRAESRFPQEVLDYYMLSSIAHVDEIWRSLSVLLDWYYDWMIPHFENLSIPHSASQVKQMRKVLDLLKQKSGQNITL